MRARGLSEFGGDARGVAAIEFALIGTLLAGALLNVAEVSRYAYLSMEVNAAAQAGAQATIGKCNPTEVPVTINCPEVDDAIETAITGTSLADRITLKGPIDEAWYCLAAGGALIKMSPAAKKPESCDEAGIPGGRPALYVRLRTAFTYEPMFPGLTIVQSFNLNIERSAMMRLI